MLPSIFTEPKAILAPLCYNISMRSKVFVFINKVIQDMQILNAHIDSSIENILVSVHIVIFWSFNCRLFKNLHYFIARTLILFINVLLSIYRELKCFFLFWMHELQIFVRIYFWYYLLWLFALIIYNNNGIIFTIVGFKFLESSLKRQ
jgi:hypothetical protein